MESSAPNPYPHLDDLRPPPDVNPQAQQGYPGAWVARADYHLPDYQATQQLISDNTIKAILIIAAILMVTALVLLLKSKVKIPVVEL